MPSCVYAGTAAYTPPHSNFAVVVSACLCLLHSQPCSALASLSSPPAASKWPLCHFPPDSTEHYLGPLLGMNKFSQDVVLCPKSLLPRYSKSTVTPQCKKSWYDALLFTEFTLDTVEEERKRCVFVGLCTYFIYILSVSCLLCLFLSFLNVWQ